MRSTIRCRKISVAAVVAAAAIGLWPAKAQAQFGFGGGGFGFGGFGWGFGGFSQVPKPESFLYQKAITDSQRDTHIPSRDVYANNPNSYFNRVRDNGFVDRYAVERREVRPVSRTRAGSKTPRRSRRRHGRLHRYPYYPSPAFTILKISSSGPEMLPSTVT